MDIFELLNICSSHYYVATQSCSIIMLYAKEGNDK